MTIDIGQNMKRRDIYVKAAELIFNDIYKFSCSALRVASPSRGEGNEYTEYCESIYRCDSPNPSSQFWFGTGGFFGSNRCQKECKEHRIMALLFAGELAKDGVKL